MDPYVLFYSLACPKSKEIADLLHKNPFQDSIKMFCIDGLPILPNYIRYTPTLQLDHPRYGRQYLIGDQIMEWLQAMLQESSKNANDMEQDNTIGSIDTAFGHQNDMGADDNTLDDMFKIDSGFNGDTPRQGISESPDDIEAKMRQMQDERDNFDKQFADIKRS